MIFVCFASTGRYHIEKCRKILDARKTARLGGSQQTTINGRKIDDDIFKKIKPPIPRPAKIRGFVVSSSVTLSDPFSAPTLEDVDKGVRTGRKGYVRCLYCNAEVFAPNASYHASTCHTWTHGILAETVVFSWLIFLALQFLLFPFSQ